jgi:competence ComEA-like helix-hairpin-helix protein
MRKLWDYNPTRRELLALGALSALFAIGALLGGLRQHDPVRVVPMSTVPAENTSGRVNVNLASAGELAVLTGIGPRIAREIVEYRSTHGAFQTPEDLLLVRGIGPTRLARIREAITLDSGCTAPLLKRGPS